MNMVSFYLKKQKTFTLKSQGLSMLPLFRPDDLIYYRHITFAHCRLNDLILIEKKAQVFTHRVIYKNKKYLVTKGDNSSTSDGKIYPHQIIARVDQVKRDGKIFRPESIYLLQSTLYFQEITKLKNAMQKEKINFIILKGLPLHLYYEKTYPRRIYLDCDILIDKKQILYVKQVLFNHDYEVLNSSLSNLHTLLREKLIEQSFYKVINGFSVVFDLHQETVFMMTQLGKLEALYPQKLIDQLTEEFLKSKRKVLIEDESFYLLSTNYLLLYLALHFFHHNFRGAFRLELLDKIIRQSKVDWIKESEMIKKYRLQNFVYPAFLLLKKYYSTPIPPSFLLTMKQHSNAAIKSILKVNIFDDEPRIQAGINRFKNLLFLSPNPIWIRLLVFFNPPVIYSIFWIFQRRLFSFFSSRKQDR